MVKALDLVGRRFERLVVQSRHPIATSGGKSRWNCLCDCGSVCVVNGSNLVKNHTRSCGCLVTDHAKKMGDSNVVHGYATDKPAEYRIWSGMKTRCYNTASKDYDRYGGRGIEVCDRWKDSFENFLEDMGSRPSPDHSIDREDNNGHYEPNNCYWATTVEQGNNKRSNVVLDHGDRKLTRTQLSRETGIAYHNLKRRTTNGMGLDEALETPVRSYKDREERVFTHNGITKSLKEWAEILGMDYMALYYQLVTRGLELKDVLRS